MCVEATDQPVESHHIDSITTRSARIVGNLCNYRADRARPLGRLPSRKNFSKRRGERLAGTTTAFSCDVKFVGQLGVYVYV